MESSATEVKLGLVYEAIGKDLGLTVEDKDYEKLASDNGFDDPEVFYEAAGIDKEYAEKFIIRDKVNKELYSMAQ